MIRVLGILLLCCAASRATLIDRWSFVTDATDSVGGNNGALVGGASVSGGALQLDGSSGYMSLPTGLVSGLHSFTIEMWFTWTDNGDLSRLFDFGTTESNYMGLTPSNEDTQTPRFGIAIASGSLHTVTSPSAISPGTPVFLAVTLDDSIINDPTVMYIDGLFASGADVVYDPSQLGSPLSNWVGASSWTNTVPFFQGSIDEIRIYDTALSSGEIAAEFAAGPDDLSVPEPGAAWLLLGGLGLVGWRLRRPNAQHPA
jgi:hypothetical protein